MIALATSPDCTLNVHILFCKQNKNCDKNRSIGADDGNRTRDPHLTKEYNKTQSPVLMHSKSPIITGFFYIKNPIAYTQTLKSMQLYANEDDLNLL